jgi:hypothetical protein
MVLARAIERPMATAIARSSPAISCQKRLSGAFRMACVRTADGVQLWSRPGKDLTSRFPDVQAALAAQLTIGCVPDGEVVVWTGEKLDFAQLQLRLVTSPAKARRMVAERPAPFVVFYMLSVNGRRPAESALDDQAPTTGSARRDLAAAAGLAGRRRSR